MGNLWELPNSYISKEVEKFSSLKAKEVESRYSSELGFDDLIISLIMVRFVDHLVELRYLN